MRAPVVHGVLIALLLISLASSTHVFAAKKMQIQASFNPTQYDHGVSVVISGRVSEINNASVSNAVISIQVNNPQGSSVRVAITYTNNLGAFKDSFMLAQDAPGGNYTAYLVADKPGFDTATLTFTFAISSPDFSITASATSLSLKQGETSSLTATILSIRDFKNRVNVTAVDQPPGVTVQTTPSSLVPSGSVTVNVGASLSATVGNYTVTILAVSGSLTHKTSFQLNVAPGPLQTNFMLLVGGAGSLLALGAVGLVLRTRRRKRKEAVLEELLMDASADTGYMATARVIARLEELRAMNKVDESTYQQLRREYEKRLEKSK